MRTKGLVGTALTAVAISACAISFPDYPLAGAGGGGTHTVGTGTTMATGTGMPTATASTSSGPSCGDAQNCGAAGIDCLGGGCHADSANNECFCDPVVIDLGGPVGRVAVGAANAYVPVKTQTGAAIAVVPTTFAPTTLPSAHIPIPDADGFIAAFVGNTSFPGGYAYSPATAHTIVACDANNTCATSTTMFGSHVNGLAFDPIVGQLFFAVPSDSAATAPSNGIGSFNPFTVPLDTSGTNGQLVVNDTPAGQLHTLREIDGNIYWTDYGGCMRALSEFDSGGVSCIPGLQALNAADVAVGDAGRTTTSPGIFVAPVGGGDLNKVTVDVSKQTGVSVPALDTGGKTIQAKAPIAIDAKCVDVSGTNEIRVYTFMTGGSPLLHTITASGSIIGMDASNLNYVFYTVGSQLFRWTKPKACRAP